MVGLWNTIKNMIKWGSLSKANSDNKSYPESQYEYNDNIKDAMNIFPWGMHANPPSNTLAVLVNISGHEENAVAIPVSSTDRLKGLKPGEVAFGSWVVSSYIKFTQNGNIEIESSNGIKVNSISDIEITAPNSIINGNVEINGDLSVDGDITATGDITAVNGVFSGNITALAVIATSGTFAGDVTVGGVSLATFMTDYPTHQHTGVTTGTSLTGGVA